MSDESAEIAEQEEPTATPPPVLTEVAEDDPYAALPEDEPHPASDVEAAPEVETAPAEAVAAEEPAKPTYEELQAKLQQAEDAKNAIYGKYQNEKRKGALEDRMAALEQAAADQEEEEEYEVVEPPDPVVDPVAYAAHTADLAREAAERVERKIDATTEEGKRAAVVAQIGARAQAQHAEFVESHADYDKAAALVVERVVTTPLRALGRTDEQIAEAAQSFSTTQILKAHQEGGSASENIYKMAQDMGYKPEEATNGDDPAKVETAPAPAAEPTPVQKVAARQKATTTLAGAPGSAGQSQSSGSIKAILAKSEADDDGTGRQITQARDYVVANVMKRLPPGATDDDAEEAIATGLIKFVV